MVTEPEPTAWTADEQNTVVTAARTILLTWSRPDRPHTQWWAELEPMLSPTAQEVYEFTDPSTIPALKIHGDGEWESYPDPYVATVWFDTDQGRFGVDVSRTALDAPWVGERIIFPGEGSILQ